MPKCITCNKLVTKKNPGVQCSKCSKWYHGSCALVTTEQLNALSVMESVDWKCNGCTAGSKGRRISVILPDPQEEESEAEGIQISHAKTLFEIHQEVQQLRKNVRDIIRDELQNTLQYYSNKIDEYEQKVKDHEMRVKIMENKCKDMANTCKNVTLRNEFLEQKISKLEQAQSSNDLEICGVSQKQEEDVKRIATSVSQILKQNPDDIIRAVRKNKPTRPGSSQEARNKIDAPIIISLREGKREQWCEAARSVKITNKDLGGENDAKVYLRDSLTPTTSYLLWKAKSELKEKALCKYVWYRNGQIMVRKRDGDKKIFYVRSEIDIERIAKEVKKPIITST